MKDDINSSYLVTLSLKFQWHTKVNEDTSHVDSSSNNAHFLKFYGWKVEFCKKWQTLAIIQEISDSNLETGRYGLPDYPKSGVSQIIQGS